MKDVLQDMVHAPDEWMGNTFRTMLAASETGGAVGIVDNAVPAGFGPPRHVHAAEDESFVVLSGEIELWVAGQTFRRGPGEAAFVPRGVEHTFKAVTEARLLLILTPGGFESFFADIVRGGYRIPEDMERIVESGARHNVTFTGPPL